jgi:hypothetical protein
VPAADLEAIVEGRICAFLWDQAAIFSAAGSVDIEIRKTLTEQAAVLARRWPTVTPADKRMLLRRLVVRTAGNDRYGHAADDLVLQTVVERVEIDTMLAGGSFGRRGQADIGALP